MTPTLLTPTGLVSRFKETIGKDRASIARTLKLEERDVGTDYIGFLDDVSSYRTRKDSENVAQNHPIS